MVSSSAGGTGTARKTPRRLFFSVSKTRVSFARSTRSAQNVRTSGSWSSAAARKRARSSAFKYLRLPFCNKSPDKRFIPCKRNAAVGAAFGGFERRSRRRVFFPRRRFCTELAIPLHGHFHAYKLELKSSIPTIDIFPYLL